MEFKTCEQYVLAALDSAEKENEQLKETVKVQKELLVDYERILKLLNIKNESCGSKAIGTDIVFTFSEKYNELSKLLEKHNLLPSDKNRVTE